MGKLIDFSSLGKQEERKHSELKPAEVLAQMVCEGNAAALDYAKSLRNSADGLVSLAVFINRCQRSLELAQKARVMFAEDINLGEQVYEAYKHVAKAQAGTTPTVIDSRLYWNFKLASNFRETGRYSVQNPEIQFLYDMKNCPKIDGDVTYYARQVDFAVGRMFATGKFSDEDIIATAMRCSPLNDSMETLMLPIMLLRDEMIKQDKAFVTERVAEGIDVDTAIEICRNQLKHRPGDEEYYAEIREYVTKKDKDTERA